LDDQNDLVMIPISVKIGPPSENHYVHPSRVSNYSESLYGVTWFHQPGAVRIVLEGRLEPDYMTIPPLQASILFNLDPFDETTSRTGDFRDEANLWKTYFEVFDENRTIFVRAHGYEDVAVADSSDSIDDWRYNFPISGPVVKLTFRWWSIFEWTGYYEARLDCWTGSPEARPGLGGWTFGGGTTLPPEPTIPEESPVETRAKSASRPATAVPPATPGPTEEPVPSGMDKLKTFVADNGGAR
jgi:hypothetical protein